MLPRGQVGHKDDDCKYPTPAASVEDVDRLLDPDNFIQMNQGRDPTTSMVVDVAAIRVVEVLKDEQRVAEAGISSVLVEQTFVASAGHPRDLAQPLSPPQP